jgi:hypothetical protein
VVVCQHVQLVNLDAHLDFRAVTPLFLAEPHRVLKNLGAIDGYGSWKRVAIEVRRIGCVRQAQGCTSLGASRTIEARSYNLEVCSCWSTETTHARVHGCFFLLHFLSLATPPQKMHSVGTIQGWFVVTHSTQLGVWNVRKERREVLVVDLLLLSSRARRRVRKRPRASRRAVLAKPLNVLGSPRGWARVAVAVLLLLLLLLVVPVRVRVAMHVPSTTRSVKAMRRTMRRSATTKWWPTRSTTTPRTGRERKSGRTTTGCATTWPWPIRKWGAAATPATSRCATSKRRLCLWRILLSVTLLASSVCAEEGCVKRAMSERNERVSE